MVPYSFPNHYPPNCPPSPRNEKRGKYYRLVKSNNKSDSTHYKSHYEAKLMEKLEATKACSRRALSMFEDRNEAISLSKQFPAIGKYIACLDLDGGHGVVCEEKYRSFRSHHNWWVPINVNACDFCLHIEGPVS